MNKDLNQGKAVSKALDMFLDMLCETTNNVTLKCLKVEHKINSKMPDLLKVDEEKLQDDLNYLLNILVQADKCINDIFEKGNIKLDE